MREQQTILCLSSVKKPHISTYPMILLRNDFEITK